MSIWGDNPEYFDEWIENAAMQGEFGPDVKAQVENGDVPGYELWDLLLKGKIQGKTKDYEYARSAELAFIERLIP